MLRFGGSCGVCACVGLGAGRAVEVVGRCGNIIRIIVNLPPRGWILTANLFLLLDYWSLRYAFGVTMWELYTAEVAFKDESSAVLGYQVWTISGVDDAGRCGRRWYVLCEGIHTCCNPLIHALASCPDNLSSACWPFTPSLTPYLYPVADCGRGPTSSLPPREPRAIREARPAVLGRQGMPQVTGQAF